MQITKLLSLKLFLIIFVIMSILSIAFSLYHLSLESEQYEKIAQQCASRVNIVVTGSLQDAMLKNERSRISKVINSIVKNDGVRSISILNTDGKIVFSTQPEDRDSLVSMESEMCSPCHLPDGDVREIKHEKFYNIFTTASGQRTLYSIFPVENKKSCAEADCHAHTDDAKFLGIVRVEFPLTQLDATIGELRERLLTANISLTIIMGLIVGLFIWFFVHVPVNELIEGTKEISSGNLNHKINLKRKDEIGKLADSFNEMTDDLKKAKEEIIGWSNQLENRVEEKTRELENTQKRNLQIEKMASLGQLSATVAHELNNPIAGILTYSKLIQKKLRKEDLSAVEKGEVSRYLNMIESESARSGEIVKNLLLFSREGKLKREPIEINPVLESALELVNHHLQLHNISLHKEFQKGLPKFAGDPNLLKQAFIALFVNAVEAMEREGILTVKTDHLDGEDALNIYIKDTGRGIPDEILPNIFEPFFTTKNAVKGVGLGLSSVFAIVEKHEGVIKVESRVNIGTTFMIKLPLTSGKES